jgi:hypothetical protein
VYTVYNVQLFGSIISSSEQKFGINTKIKTQVNRIKFVSPSFDDYEKLVKLIILAYSFSTMVFECDCFAAQITSKALS